MFEADSIVGARVIHQGIDVAESRDRLLHNRLAVRRRRKIHDNEADLQTLALEFVMQLLTSCCVPIHGDCHGAFLGAGSGDGRTDAFRTARYQHNLVFEFQVHGSGTSNRRSR